MSGYQLDRVQQGLEPTDWKPMSSVGQGVMEIRVREDGQFRIFYVTRFRDAVHVLHCFSKKTQKTTKADIDIGATRYKAVVGEQTKAKDHMK